MGNAEWDPVAEATKLLENHYGVLSHDSIVEVHQGLIPVDHILQRNGVPHLVQNIAKNVLLLPHLRRYFEMAFIADVVERVSYSIAAALDRSTDEGGYQIPPYPDMRMVNINKEQVLCRLSKSNGMVRLSAASEAGILIVDRAINLGNAGFGHSSLLYAELDTAAHAYRLLFHTPYSDEYSRIVGSPERINNLFMNSNQVIRSFEQVLPLSYPPGYLSVLQ